ncbi:TlpA family protein disulfide reductase [Pedobacter hartonius]|uniref:Thiol-disulfide isomerase or thioredoxin n=1 Tax=Pedobacter hartonius TaxID=425514 RepID=A0A1H3Z2C9_9SPHI|nr:TlpA disulfide reductase family protein [Pedobacter hartonius]SEA17472.1 Thiol-disulfide isomerase or thioredoxin [Pedobacter hartonius]
MISIGSYKVKIVLAVLSILVLSIAFLCLYPRTSKLRLSGPFIGNWINKENNNWQFGFFEEFAIYHNNFWTYKEVKTQAKGAVDLVLIREEKIIKLHLEKEVENELAITQEDGAKFHYVLMPDRYPDYTTADHTPFNEPRFSLDSVTVIGYYRNLDQGIKGFVERFFRSPFEVSIADFITGEEVKYYADMNDRGTFKLTFPVMNTQELYVDWKRTRIRAVVAPGDTLFVFVDIADYMPNARDKKNYRSYVDRPKEVLFMGNNARLNNELRQYTDPPIAIDKAGMTGLDDMQYLRQCEEVYQRRLANLSQHISQYPRISDKFVKYKQTEEKYDFAFNLMQHRFDLSGRTVQRFQEAYFNYVKVKFPLDDPSDYTMTRYFGRFISDYLGYLSENNAAENVLFSEIGERLQDDGKLTGSLATQIAVIDTLAKKLKFAGDQSKVKAEISNRADRLNNDPLVRHTAEILQAEKNFIDMRLADSVLHNQNLRELWWGNRYNYWFEVLRKPLASQKLTSFRRSVNNPYIINHIEQMQAHYKVIANEGKSYQAGLKNSDQLKDSKDARRLVEALLKPYKGKVIYIDFWGTWCSPCRRDLKMVHALKQKLASNDVIFMYFANRSPEDTWRNMIYDLQLSGTHVIHYRLPDEQQGMLERQLGVTTFPTYMLVDKEGNIVDKNAGSPTNTDYTASAIKKLL